MLPQSRRHTYIASLLRIPHVGAAVNKMELVSYDEAGFQTIRREFLELTARLDLPSVELIPVSALAGDNVVDRSPHMPWYSGPTLLDYLETVPLQVAEAGAGPLRFPVQLVVRPDATFRGFAGRVERGEMRPGTLVRALPSGRTTRVRSLVTYDGELKQAHWPQSITVELDDEIDLSRGEMLVAEEQAAPLTGTRLRAMTVWMHEQPLTVGATYLLKHTTRTVRATARRLAYRVDVNSTEHEGATELALNDIGEVELETSLPLFFDPYRENRSTGSFILIDPLSNATLGAGMLLGEAPEGHAASSPWRALRFVLLRGDLAAVQSWQHTLQAQGHKAVIVDDPLIADAALPGVVRALQLAGVVGLSAREDLAPGIMDALRAVAGEGLVEDAADLAREEEGA